MLRPYENEEVLLVSDYFEPEPREVPSSTSSTSPMPMMTTTDTPAGLLDYPVDYLVTTDIRLLGLVVCVLVLTVMVACCCSAR